MNEHTHTDCQMTGPRVLCQQHCLHLHMHSEELGDNAVNLGAKATHQDLVMWISSLKGSQVCQVPCIAAGDASAVYSSGRRGGGGRCWLGCARS